MIPPAGSEPAGRAGRLATFLAQCRNRIGSSQPLAPSGYLTRAAGLVMEAVGLKLALGSTCTLSLPNGNSVEAEVVGFSGDRLFLMPAQDVYGLAPGARVAPQEAPVARLRMGDREMPRRRTADRGKHVPVGAELLGRVLDGAGKPLDRLPPLSSSQMQPLYSRPLNPLERTPIEMPLDVGVRAINALLTVGRGQRMGLFAGSGVGKSVLLGMMARYTTADVTVVGLIGERGREVKEFIEKILGPEGMARSVVVAAPADTSPLMRLQGAAYATAAAEYFRDQGRNVLLIMDSLTRYAQAQREIGLAIGEAPATKGYPPSVFARLPQLVERAGNSTVDSGSITAFYTVLTEGDDQQDPIADAARAILDGHIVLSRRIAEAGQYPAIDVEASISRVMHDIVPAIQLQQARRLKQLLSTYEQNRDLIAIGAYHAGADPRVDAAIAAQAEIREFLHQDLHERVSFTDSVRQLDALIGAA